MTPVLHTPSVYWTKREPMINNRIDRRNATARIMHGQQQQQKKTTDRNDVCTFTLGVDKTSDGFNVKLLGRVFSARPMVPRSHGTSGTI